MKDVAILGCGYVGLSLVVGAVRAGFDVLGVENDPGKVEKLVAGVSPSDDVDVTDAELTELLATGRLRFDGKLDGTPDVIALCVPTPLRDGQPDISYIEAAGEETSRHLKRGALVVLESTTYPGTTEEALRPILEEGSGLRAGEDFHLAHSPERIDPGNRTHGLRNTPKVVGGLTDACTAAAVSFYRELVDEVVAVSSPRAAEMSKLLENSFRHVNIALANEMAMVCHDLEIDPWEVLAAASTKPFGFMPFRPGPGVGGHCLLPGERVVLRDEDGVRVTTVEEAWERHAIAPFNAGATEVAVPSGLRTASIDGWDAVTAIGRRRFAGTAVRVRTRDGRSLTVTPDHRMLVYVAGALVERRAERIQPGDLVPVWHGDDIAEPLLNPLIEVLDAVPASWNVGVRIAGGWRFAADAIAEIAGRPAAHGATRSGRVPLRMFRDMEQRGLRVDHRDLELWTGRGRAARGFSAVVELTPDVARMIGYYLAEGCVTDHAQKTVFAFHGDEVETKQDLCKILDSLGVRWSAYEDPDCRTTQIKVSSRLFALLLTQVLGCGSNSYDARIPPVVLGASPAHRRELLSGALRGDGSVHTTSGRHRRTGYRSNSIEIGYFTASEQLAADIEYVFRSLGYVPSLYRRRHRAGVLLSVHGTQDVAWLGELLCDARRERVRTYDAGLIRRNRRSRSYVRERGMHLVAVTRVERERYAGPVYSLETERTGTFAATNGIVVHNCVPIDPQYLAWRVRGRFGHQFRMLELAHDINERMPAYAVQRAAEILNEHGKALRGARILLVGMAYKGGSSDTRESPALRVASRLVRVGAEVAYHDPHVPKVTIDGLDRESIEITDSLVGLYDLVVVLTAHPDVDHARIARSARLVFDTVNATEGAENVYRA